MKAVILAGGRGERLKPITDRVPKPMLPVNNRPIIENLMEYLKNYGIKDFIITLGYKGEIIKKYFGDGSKFGFKIEYALEKIPMGTAGCLLPLKEKLDDTFILIGGDNLTKMNLKKMINFHKKNDGVLTVAIFDNFEKTKWGIYDLKRDKSVKSFREKPMLKNAIGTMIFCLEPEILNYIPRNGSVFNITDHLIPRLLEMKKKIYGFEFTDFWIDIGNLDDYHKVKKIKNLF